MIQKIINDITTKEAEEEREKVLGEGITTWRSSGLGTCMRGRFLNRLLSGSGIKPEIDPRTLHVFEIGNQVEDWLMNKLKKQNQYRVVQQGKMFDPEFNLSGHFDALLIEGKEGEIPKSFHLVECKSKHSKAFWYMDKKGEGAQVHHKMQLHSYLYMINKYGFELPSGSLMPPTKVEKGSILYVSKDDMAMLEYPVFLDDPELEKMWKYEIQTLNECWDKHKTPPANAEGSWQEKYCDYCKLGMCQTLDDKMVEELFEVSKMPTAPKPSKVKKESTSAGISTGRYISYGEHLNLGDRVYLSDKKGLFPMPKWPVFGSPGYCAGTVIAIGDGNFVTVGWDNGEKLTLTTDNFIKIETETYPF